MAFYYYDDYNPGPSYYDPEPIFYAPPDQYDAYYHDPGPEPAYDDYALSSYHDGPADPFYHAENTPPFPYDFLADAPLPDDQYEPGYANSSYTDDDAVAYAAPYTSDAVGSSSPAPYNFLADQPLDWEDDEDDFGAPYLSGCAHDVADGAGTQARQGLSCAGDEEYAEDEFEEEYDAEADRLAAAFDATMRGVTIAEAYGLGPPPDGAPAGYEDEPDAHNDGRYSPSFTEEYDEEADRLAAEFDMDWNFDIPIPRAWRALETQAGASNAYQGDVYEVEDEAEVVSGPEGCIERYGEQEYVADTLSSPSSSYSDLYHDHDTLYDDEYAPYASRTDFWTGTCTLDDRLHALAMQSTAHQLAFEYRSLPDAIPQLRPLSPYPDDDTIPEFDGAAYEDELERFHDAFAALARMPVPAEPEPSQPPSYSGLREPEACRYDTGMLPWSDDDDERLDACIEALQQMQLAGYYPDCFDTAPLNLYDAHTYLVSDANKTFLGPPPSWLHRPPRPPRIPRFRPPCPRNTSPPRRKRPPDKLHNPDASKTRRTRRRQPRSRTPTRPRRDPPPHLPAEHPRQDEPEFVDAVTLPDEAVPPDRRVPAPHAAKVSDAGVVVREPVPPDRPSTALSAAKVADAAAVVREPVPPDIHGKPLTVEQRRRNALRRIARKKKPK